MSKKKVMTDEGEWVDSIQVSGGGYVEKERKEPIPRKSLAIDKDTYDLLREICAKERRSLIHQLQRLIEAKHQELFYKDYL